jgi:adenosylhomocysteine nucleosidase
MRLSQLLQYWLRDAAREKVVSAVQEQMAETAATTGGAAPSPRADFGVVFALAIEAGGLLDLLSDVTTTKAHGFVVRQGQRHQRAIVVVESGPGVENAAVATQAMLDVHRPAWVVSAGFAGALDPSLRRGDLVVAESIVDSRGGSWAANPAHLPDWLPGVGGLRLGRLVTVDAPVRSPGDKRALGAQHAALAVDMESLAVAELCRSRDVPVLAVRVICDAVEDRLPPDVEKLLRHQGARQLGAALGSVFRRPGSLKDLAAMQHNALVASDRLGRFLSGLVKHLPL